MSDEKSRILSYKLASILEPENLEQVAGGAASLKTMRTQKVRNTRGGDTTIDFDDFDFE